MIIKSFELKNKDLKNFKYFLLHGNNKGYIQEIIEKVIKPQFTKNIYKYEENEILIESNNFEENIANKSFFENEKLIIINRVTNKILKIIENIVKKNIEDVIVILISDNLDKKSKLRTFFEKDKQTVCIPFYEDDQKSLGFIANKFFKDNGISISQENINLITERSSGDRINLRNELNKIKSFAIKTKKISSMDIIKLTNLSENFSISEFLDNALAKNHKRTLHIMNENNFASEDTILILRIFISKLKRLLKIQKQIQNEKNTAEKIIASFKPPIFWKEKDIVNKQIKNLSVNKIYDLISETNKIELLIKKNPSISTNIITNFILEQATESNN